MSANIEIGRCRSCKWRTSAGHCESDKLREDYGGKHDDELIYSYVESGRFWVGPNFGCVHFAAAEHQEALSPDLKSTRTYVKTHDGKWKGPDDLT